MAIPLRVLIVEDSENDTLLLVHELRRGGYEPVHERVPHGWLSMTAPVVSTANRVPSVPRAARLPRGATRLTACTASRRAGAARWCASCLRTTASSSARPTGCGAGAGATRELPTWPILEHDTAAARRRRGVDEWRLS